MARRTTTIGKGLFGYAISKDEHMSEVLRRIIRRRLPLTEDAVFVLMYHILKRNNQGIILKCVKGSKDVGGCRYFNFSPDIDLLEIRKDGTIVGYELKGYRKSKGGHVPPLYYEGVDEALAYLVNPVGTPMSYSTFAGSIFDHVYLVHPFQETFHSGLESLTNLLHLCTPIGLAVVDYSGVKELVKAKRNPFVKEDIKQLFLRHLDAFRASFEYRLSLVQK